jgi:hypothetical protein
MIKSKLNNLNVACKRLLFSNTYITYHPRFIPKGVAEASQIFLRDAQVLPKLLIYEEYCRRDRWQFSNKAAYLAYFTFRLFCFFCISLCTTCNKLLSVIINLFITTESF